MYLCKTFGMTTPFAFYFTLAEEKKLKIEEKNMHYIMCALLRFIFRYFCHSTDDKNEISFKTVQPYTVPGRN
jgi:hypothetical protein